MWEVKAGKFAQIGRSGMNLTDILKDVAATTRAMRQRLSMQVTVEMGSFEQLKSFIKV